MFTGIVDHCGEVLEVLPSPARVRLRITTRFADLLLGESISVDGICLTVSDRNALSFICDVSPETLKLTISQSYRKGQRVNLERALRFGDPLGGHLLTGHVDQIVQVEARKESDLFLILRLGGIHRVNARYLVKKGSISLNGVSLTLGEVWEHGFEVMLIPHTLERSNLRELRVGDGANVEFDYFCKCIVQEVQRHMERV